MKMYVGTDWIGADQSIEVLNPFDGSVVDTVPKATPVDVDRAIAAAARGAKTIADLTGYERSLILRRAGDLVLERVEELASLITREEGKIIGEARIEVNRAAEILYLSAEEAKRLNSEVVPLDGGPGVRGKFGFTLRVPCGVVAAISPFNFPLHLVCHKVGPALAGGNSVIVKPATDTPLSGLKLVEILLEAGIPPEAVQCLTGAGSDIGDMLVSDPRIRKITFTGSRDVGEHITKTAGLKKVTMELGSNSPVIIMDDADMDKVTAALVQTTFANAGQVCISTQRIYADSEIYSDFVEAFGAKVSKINYGDPFDESVMMGPLVRSADAERVANWIDQAVTDGAKVITGGNRDGGFVEATLLADVDPAMRVSCEELFGPAAAVSRVRDLDQAIDLANDSPYGLSAAIFTQDIDRAMKFARKMDSGNIHINWGSQWRTDLMPYGGLKQSGMGKEGPRYAVRDMTEEKLVVMHLDDH